MCCFKFSVTFYCESHLSQRFPGLRMHSFDKYGSDSFTGVRPLVVPLDRTLSLLSARSPLHWECIIRPDKRLPCEKPFMAPEAEPCTGSGDPHNLDETGEKWCTVSDTAAGRTRVLWLRARLLRCWICYSAAEESTKTVTSGWCVFLHTNIKHQAKHYIV